MRIVVLGGSGLIGSKLVNLLRQDGPDVVSTSHTSGLNTVTGEGLDGALADAQVVVDVTNSPSFEDKAVLEFFTTSGRHIVAAEMNADVTHHVALSVVGAGSSPGKRLFSCEIGAGTPDRGIAYPLHDSPFNPVFRVLGEHCAGRRCRTNSACVACTRQPIAPDDVAATLANVAVNPPVNGIVEVAGPERVSLAELVKRFLLKTGDSRQVLADNNARYYGAVLNDQSLTPGANPRIGSTTFEEWFSTSMLKT